MGLETRMLLTMFLLAALYLLFLAVLWSMGVGRMTMLLMGCMIFIQYFFSDKIYLQHGGQGGFWSHRLLNFTRR